MPDIEKEDGIEQPEREAVQPPNVGQVAQCERLDGHVGRELYLVQEVSLALPILAVLKLVSHVDPCRRKKTCPNVEEAPSRSFGILQEQALNCALRLHPHAPKVIVSIWRIGTAAND